MGDLVIKTHDFELAKKGLKEFSQKKEQDLEIDTVRTDGGFLGLGNHKVTGYELNNRLSVIQKHLIDLNATNNRTIKEFGQVYKALEALDKDYIQGILISIKATEETSKGIAAAQEKITQIIEDQKKTLEILKKFKQKLDGYAHLGDIDKIWSDCQAWHAESSALMASVAAVTDLSTENAAAIKELTISKEAAASKIGEISDNLDEQISRIETLISFMDKLDAIVHLGDVDEMWDSLTNAQTDLQKLCAEMVEAQAAIAKNAEDISKIQGFVDLLSRQTHLNDIDAMWDKTEEHTAQIASLQEQDETIKGIINNNKDATDKVVSELQKKDEQLDKLIQSNKAAVDQVVAELQEKNAAQDELIHTNKAAADQAIATLEEKNAALSDLVQENKEAVDQEVADLQEHDAAAMKLIEENKLLAEQALAEANEQTTTMMQQLNKKLMYAYLIAGGSLALAIAELVLILLR